MVATNDTKTTEQQFEQQPLPTQQSTSDQPDKKESDQNDQNKEKEAPATPTTPGEWSLKDIEAKLSRPLPKSYIHVKPVGGQQIPFIPWYYVNRILTKYCPGWSWEITKFELSSDRAFIVGRLTVPTSDGNITREATGCELLDCSSYGDPSSNAESMAFRRAAARFGLGLYLYDK